MRRIPCSNGSPWFEVDRKGLAGLVANRDKSFIVNELIQNAWDQDVTKVTVTLTDASIRGYSILTVEDDDPSGFAELAHAFTLFAESNKKGDVAKRGRFNLGEKLVLSVCRSAMIDTVGKTIKFDEKLGRIETKNKRTSGSMFTGMIRLTDMERDQVVEACHNLIQPDGIATTINGTPLADRDPVATFELQMPTLGVDAEGNLFNTKRITRIDVYEPFDGETPAIYEMGIPVVELENDIYHIDVQQKVPLNMDRDNVSPAYLTRLRMGVLNNTHHLLTEQDCDATWVKEATAHPESSAEAVDKMLTGIYGEKRVIHNPADPEATAIAVSKGYNVIYGRSLTAGQHSRVRDTGAAQSASVVTPSPKPYSEDGDPVKTMEPNDDMMAVEELAKRIAEVCLEGKQISVIFAKEPKWPFGATYGPSGELTLNAGRLGKNWFKPDNLTRILDLLIHEFGHQYESNHLSDRYYKALTKIGSRLAVAVRDNPDIIDLGGDA